jgi:predicted ATPase/transcriptional regulator with XRE-family HTH domain
MPGRAEHEAGSFGARLRRWRERAGLSQEELGERAGLTGQAVGALERGDRRRPYPETVRRLADALALSDEERIALLDAIPRRAAAPAGPGQEHAAALDAVESTGAHDAAGDHAHAVQGLPALPAPLTTLVGREADIAAVARMLGEGTRLLTLTGPGGVGKTRLAIAAANDVCDGFPHGVAFVPLAALTDAALVMPTIAHALGLREVGGRPPWEALRSFLHTRRLLLVLDNFEHVLTAAPELAQLLEACPQLVVLATSRAPLQVRGERDYPVAPLAVPDFSHVPSLDEVACAPAVRLFVERAQAARPDFALTGTNAPSVAAICRRLDGLPLALELAAPRIRMLPPTALLARLDQALPLLAGGARDLPDRQRTLRDTLAWSYRLLEGHEQVLFRRLAVFADGCTLDAATAVCADASQELDVLERLEALLNRNLLKMRESVGGEPRYWMLEMIRQYAHELLQASGEEAAIRWAHAGYVVTLVEAIEPQLWGPEQVRWMARLAAEQDNVRAALRWLLDHGDYAGVGRLVRRLHFPWWIQGQMVEARRWADDLLAHGDQVPPPARAVGHFVRGWAAIDLGGPEALEHLGEALTLARAVGDRWTEGHCLLGQGFLRPLQNDLAGGIALMWEGQRALREAGDEWGVGVSLTGLSTLSVVGGWLDDAEAFAEEHVLLARRMGDLRSIGHALDDLAMAALLREAFGRAVTLYRESIALCTEVGQWELVAYGLMGLAVVAAREQPRRAARLFGAAEALRETSGVAIWPARRTLYDHALALARDTLGAAAFDAEWAAGGALSRRDALAEALDEPA